MSRKVPAGVGSVMEIIINGRDLATIAGATQAAIAASVDTPGLLQDFGGQLRRPTGQELYLPSSRERQPA